LFQATKETLRQELYAATRTIHLLEIGGEGVFLCIGAVAQVKVKDLLDLT